MTTSDTQRATIFLNPDLLKHAKAQAVIEETSLTLLIEKALVRYLPAKTVIKKVKIKGGEKNGRTSSN